MGSLKTTLITNLPGKRVIPNKPVELFNFNKGEEVIVRFEDLGNEGVEGLLIKLGIAEKFEEIVENEKPDMGDTERIIDLTKEFDYKRKPRKIISIVSLNFPDLPVKYDSIEFLEMRP